MGLLTTMKHWLGIEKDEFYCRLCGYCVYTTKWRFKQHDCTPVSRCKFGFVTCQVRSGKHEKNTHMRCTPHLRIHLKWRKGEKYFRAQIKESDAAKKKGVKPWLIKMHKRRT